MGVMGTLYRLELRHQRYPADASDSSSGLNASTDWLCAWLGSEHTCVNVSRKLVDWGTGEVHARLSHSSRLLNGTGKLKGEALPTWPIPSRLLSSSALVQALPPTTA